MENMENIDCEEWLRRQFEIRTGILNNIKKETGVEVSLRLDKESKNTVE